MAAVGADHQTFIFADLAGYTALTEAHGDEYAADVAAAFCQSVRALLDEHSAEEVKAIGDELMLRVPDPAEAVALARCILGELGTRHGALAVRVGMHTGPAVSREGDRFGSTVNVASRVADEAIADEILMTHATRDATAAKLADLDVRPRGARRLKNVSEPVDLFALIVASEHAQGGLPLDPVCRMAVDPAHESARVVHRGVQYHLCSQRCADAFAPDPSRYLGRRSDRRDLLVSDRARDRATRRLSRAYRQGRLTEVELERRVEDALGPDPPMGTVEWRETGRGGVATARRVVGVRDWCSAGSGALPRKRLVVFAGSGDRARPGGWPARRRWALGPLSGGDGERADRVERPDVVAVPGPTGG